MDPRLTRQVRSFNRIVTRQVGAFDDSYLARGRPLGEARLLFEAGLADGVDLTTLRQKLGLDSGYLSRLLRSLEGQGLVELRAKPGDGRAREIHLMAKGREEFEAYDTLSDSQAEEMLSRLGVAQRERLVSAMAEVEKLLRTASIAIDVESGATADARQCLEHYCAELAERFEEGFDPSSGNSFDPTEMIPPQGWFVVARLDGAPVGCGALKRLDDGIGEIKRVWTSSAVRGMGVATKIMDRLEKIAAEEGYATLRLDTNRALVEARAMYLKRGFREIAPYNDNPYANYWFEKDIKGFGL